MDSLKYSDLVVDDGAIQKLIADLGNLKQTYEADIKAIIAACQQMKAAMNGAGGGNGSNAAALAQQASEIDKLKAKYDELNGRYKSNNLEIEKYKAKIAELKQEMKAEAKAQLENTQGLKQAQESYNRLAALYTKLKIELNKYSQAEIDSTAALKAKQQQAEATMAKMKALQAATGRHTLDVGNYSKALNGLGLATQQIVREMPSLAMSANQFFLAISNNIPIFTDNFKRVKEELGSTKIALQTTLKSVFSWQTALVLGITLLSKYGTEIAKWFGNFLNIGKGFDVAAEGLKGYNETMSKVSGQMAESAATLETYVYALENGNKSETEQQAILGLVNDQYAKQIEYLGIEIKSVEDLIANKSRLLDVLTEEAKVRGVLNKIVELSGTIAERQTSNELKRLQDALNAAESNLKSAGGSQFTAGYAIVWKSALDNLKEYTDETAALEDQMKRLQDLASGMDFTTLFTGGGGKKGGGSTGTVKNRDLEFIRAAEDAALEAQGDNIITQTQEIKYEYTRRIADLQTYLKEQQALEQDKREITVVGETAILNQIKSLHLVMDQEIADAWYNMLAGQVEDLNDALDAEIKAFTAADKKMLRSSAGGRGVSAERALSLQYQAKKSGVMLSTYGNKDAQASQLRALEIEYKEGVLALWEEDATKTTWEIEKLRNEIELLKKESAEEADLSWFEKLRLKITSIFDKRDLKDISKAIKQAVNYVMEQFQEIADARVELAEQWVEASEKELEATKSVLDQEIEARSNGYANNVALAQQEYLEKQRINEQALAEQEAATAAQERLNTVQQVLSLVTASANIFSSLSTIPFGVGIPIAIGLIATMMGAFVAAKVQAAQLTATTYGEGGTELLMGGSHQSGNDIPLGTMPDGSERRAEGGEYLAIINKRSSRKYGALIPAVVDALNAGVFEQKYGNVFSGNGGIVLNVDGSADAIESFHRDMKEALSRRNETRLPDGTRIITYGHTRKIIRS